MLFRSRTGQLKDPVTAPAQYVIISAWNPAVRGKKSAMVNTTAGPMAGQTVLVTGGTGGIGRATATGLAAMGARVGITGRDIARTRAAAIDITAASGNPAVDPFPADMSSQAEVRRLAGEVLATYPRLDVLVNNVGGFWATRRARRGRRWPGGPTIGPASAPRQHHLSRRAQAAI